MPTFSSIDFREETPVQGLVGHGGGLEGRDSFAFQNGNQKHSLTEDFTPPSVGFLPGCFVPLFFHTHVSVEYRKVSLFGRY